MAKRKAFLVRLPEELLDQLNLWARDDLRSLNAQIEYLLREQVRRRHRAVGSGSQDSPAELDAGPNQEDG